jgi:NADH:ubiquinone oxidoreductase subunit E
MKNPPKLVVICNGKSCHKDGANNLLNTFKQYHSDEFIITTKYCFGQCGNGPMVLILPGEKLYDHVTKEKILSIVNSFNDQNI